MQEQQIDRQQQIILQLQQRSMQQGGSGALDRPPSGARSGSSVGPTAASALPLHATC